MRKQNLQLDSVVVVAVVVAVVVVVVVDEPFLSLVPEGDVQSGIYRGLVVCLFSRLREVCVAFVTTPFLVFLIRSLPIAKYRNAGSFAMRLLLAGEAGRFLGGVVTFLAWGVSLVSPLDIGSSTSDCVLGPCVGSLGPVCPGSTAAQPGREGADLAEVEMSFLGIFTR